MLARAAAPLLLIAIVSCGCGQYMLSVANDGPKAVAGYALGLAAFAIAVYAAPKTLTIRSTTNFSHQVHRALVPVLPIVLLLITLATLNNPRLLVVSCVAWVASMCAGVIATLPGDFSLNVWTTDAVRRLREKVSGHEVVLFSLVFLIGAALRLYDLGAYPSGIHGDEAKFGVLVEDILNGKFISPFADLGSNNYAMFLYLELPFVAALGHDAFSLRLLTALAGVAAMPVFYLLVRQLFGVRVALLALALFAGNAVLNAYGRYAYVFAFVPFVGCALLFLLWQGQRTRRLGWWFASGIIGGLTLYCYFSGQILVVIAAVYVAYLMAIEPNAWRHWLQGAFMSAAGATLAIAPAVAHYRLFGANERVSSDAIFSNWPAAMQQQGTTSPVGVLVGQIRTNFLAFFSGHGGNVNDANYFTHSPMFPSLLGPLLVLGIVLLAWQVRDRRFALMLIWFWIVVLIPGALTIDSPLSYRLLPAMVPAVCAIALAMDWIIQAPPRFATSSLTAPLIMGSTLIIGVAGYSDQANYFRTARGERPWDEPTLQGTYIASLGPDFRAYVMGTPAIYYTIWPRFLAPDTPGADFHNPADLPLAVPADRSVAFLVYGAMRDSLPMLEAIYPSGHAEDEYIKAGLDFTGFVVPKADIASHQGLTANYAEATAIETPGAFGRQAPSYPADVNWTGSIHADQPGNYILRMDGALASIAIDGAPLANGGQTALWTGWHTIDIKANISSGSNPTLIWQPPNSSPTAVDRRSLFDQTLPNTLHAKVEDDAGNSSQRWDRAIGFRDTVSLWGTGKPTTATWDGTLKIPRTGSYQFGLVSQGQAEMSIDGQSITANPNTGGLQTSNGTVALATGNHAFRLRYKWVRDSGIIEAWWTPPGEQRSVIPWSAFGPPV